MRTGGGWWGGRRKAGDEVVKQNLTVLDCTNFSTKKTTLTRDTATPKKKTPPQNSNPGCCLNLHLLSHLKEKNNTPFQAQKVSEL